MQKKNHSKWLLLEYRASCDHPWRPVSLLCETIEDAYEALTELWGSSTEVQVYMPQEAAVRHSESLLGRN